MTTDPVPPPQRPRAPLRKYIIYWDAGYGNMTDIIEARSHGEAMKEAYNAWFEEAEGGAIYGAELYTEGDDDE